MPDGIEFEKIDTKKISEEIKKHASESRNEEEIKIRVETTLRPILEKWGIQWASYEHRHEISGVRKDALYGHVIIEYKAPGKLDSPSEFNKVKEQVKGYIRKEAADEKYFGRYFGIIIDGNKISFVRYRKNEWDEQEKPLEVNGQTILRLLEAIRGLRRKPLDAELLLTDFGPKSEISKKVILALYDSLIDKNTPRTDMLFDDWKRVFSQVCSYSADKLSGLVDYYGLINHKKVDVEKLLYVIHTYYTILMKLLTSEIVTLFADPTGILGASYLKKLEEAYYRSKDKKYQEFLEELKILEEGGIFKEVGIGNFLEADYFAWYLDEWNEKIAESISELNKRLLDYEPATVELNPERVKDLFKRLYQNLVPRDVRHSLGEYFTPDWLAELVLNETGYDGNPDKKVLDPACGSGTFLVLTIKRIREYARENFLDERELLNKIIKNVRGIDLNPLAVLASKANYIIALSDLIRYRPRGGIEIPIYLADSISVIRKITPFGEHEFELRTNEGVFWVTKEVIDKNLLYPVLRLIDEGVRSDLDKKDFEKFLSDRIPLTRQSVSSFLRLYEKIVKLERMGKNKIWTSLLKNSFAPMLIGKFDYVVGNPPWINWENLPEFYRNDTKQLWDIYGLLKKTKGMGLGKVKRDIAMLFIARCFSQYVNNDGILAFLIPFTTYKNPAGAGFRSFLSNKCYIQKIHDLVELHPFEGAINRTSLIVIKGGQTKFPIPCLMWSNPRSKGIDMETELEDVKKSTKQFDMILTPVQKGKSETPWMIITKKAYSVVEKLMKPSQYRAYTGVFTGINSVYWIDILSKQPNGILIKNQSSIGKKKVNTFTTVIEPEFIFPHFRGRDVKKWFAKPSNYIIIPTRKTGESLTADELKIKYPNTYKYFDNFFKDLINRKGEPFKTKLDPYRRKSTKVTKNVPPFYMLFNTKPSFERYKVAWKIIAGKISGKGEFSVSVVSTIQDPNLGLKTSMLGHKLIFIPTEDINEANYLASVLNSSFVELIVSSYTIETGISTHVPNYIYIPKFNSKIKSHLELSELSKKAHELAKKYYEQNDLVAQEELKKVEEEIDKTVGKLYGITDEELKEIKKTLRILKEGEVEEEETEEEDMVLPKTKNIEVKIEPLFVKENATETLECAVSNNSDKSLSDVKVSISLGSKSLISENINKIDKNSSQTVTFNSPKLKSGEYDLRILLDISGAKSEEKRKLFVGTEKKEKKAKSGLDKEIERLLK